MSKNCIVTNYVDVINNDNLPLYGYSKIKIVLNNNSSIVCNTNGTVILVDGTFTDTGERTASVTANTRLYFSTSTITLDNPANNYVIVQIPRYTTKYVSIAAPVDGVLDLTWLKYSYADAVKNAYLGVYVSYQPNNYEIIGLDNNPSLFADIAEFMIAKGILQNEIDITNLGKNGKLNHFSFDGITTNLVGSLDNVGKSAVNGWPDTFFPKTKEVSLDIVNFVNNNRTAGRTTGDLNLLWVGQCTVKANGVVLDIPAERNNQLTWTASSITFRGETIE